jgi:preprotein translocase subunit SecD
MAPKTPTTSRPGRSLLVLVAIFVVLGATAVIQGASSVKLGLDLRGGTSVTLQPRIVAGQTGKVTAAAIDQAVAIIRQRVNSLGVAESEVTATGTGSNRQIVMFNWSVRLPNFDSVRFSSKAPQGLPRRQLHLHRHR